MKIGILSDVHANIFGLCAVLDGIRREGAERIICAGDVLGYYPFVNEVCEILREHHVLCIRGNHDMYVLDRLPVGAERRQLCAIDYTRSVLTEKNRLWLERLPNWIEIKFDGIHVTVFHGSPWDPFEEYVYPDSGQFAKFLGVDADVVVLGHTHYPMMKRVGRKLICNPGSCGQPRDRIL